MPTPLGADEELRRLKDFLEQLRSVLQSVVDQPEDIVPGRHRELMHFAWGEVLSEFDRLAAAISPNNRPVLEGVGLVGFRLRFELGVFDDARARLLDHASEVFSHQPWTVETRPQSVSPKSRGWKRGLRWLLKKCLGSGDVVLGSLASLFPPAEAIKQFKEGIEQCIDFAGDRG